MLADKRDDEPAEEAWQHPALSRRPSLRKDERRAGDRVPPFRRVLVANRGEIAVRIIRACRELGMEAVAVYSDADAGSRSTSGSPTPRSGSGRRRRPRATCGSTRSSRPRSTTGAEAVHPGYGFLAERAAFARAVEDAGPRLRRAAVGHDRRARRQAARPADGARRSACRPCPGRSSRRRSIGPTRSPRSSPRPSAIGFPLLVKAAAGGGGRGMRRVAAAGRPAGRARRRIPRGGRRRSATARSTWSARSSRPATSRSSCSATRTGRVVAIGERDCSLQRRHQKLVEEAPAPGPDDATERRDLHEMAVQRRDRGRPPERRDRRVPPRRRTARSGSSRSTPGSRSSTA